MDRFHSFIFTLTNCLFKPVTSVSWSFVEMLTSNSKIQLTYFMPLVSFSARGKHQKITSSFLMFSGIAKRNYCYEMSQKLKGCSKKLVVRKALVKTSKQYAIDSHRRCSAKKVYLKISPNSQKSTGVRVSGLSLQLY